MKKKFTAAFVSSLIAVGVIVATIDDAEEELHEKDYPITLVGLVAVQDLEVARENLSNLFCTTTTPEDPSTDQPYVDCIAAQKKMFSRGISVGGVDPPTHFAASWRMGKSQFEILQVVRKSENVRIVLSTLDHPCVAKKDCDKLGLHVESFKDTLRRLGMKTINGDG